MYYNGQMSAVRGLRLAIVEDDGLFRELLRCSLGTLGQCEVVGDYGEPDSALADLPSLTPDVLLLDIHLGKGRSGIDLGLALRRCLPDLGIVLLSHDADAGYLAALSDQDCIGWSYLVKKSVGDLETLNRAIRSSAAGLVVLDPLVVRGLGRQTAPGASDREQQALELVAQGFSNSAIALRLCLSEKTVESLLSQMYRRLGIDTRDPKIHPRVRAAVMCLEGRVAARG